MVMEIKFKINEKNFKKLIDVSRKYFKWKNNAAIVTFRMMLFLDDSF